jgi:hypothetical protein
MIDMIEKMHNISRIQSHCRTKDKDKNNVEFEKIVKFLNDQKAVLDYAGLN